MPVPPQPTVSLKDRIAALQQKTTNGPIKPSPIPKSASTPSASDGSHVAILKSKIAAFEEKGSVPAPRGSFGMGAMPTKEERDIRRRRGELYGNRIQGGPLNPHRTGGGFSPHLTGQLTGQSTGQYTGGDVHPRSISDSFPTNGEPGEMIHTTSFSEDTELGVEPALPEISQPRYERRFSSMPIPSPPSPSQDGHVSPFSPSPTPPQPRINRATPFVDALQKAKRTEAAAITPDATGNGISPQPTGVTPQVTGGGWNYARFGGLEQQVGNEESQHEAPSEEHELQAEEEEEEEETAAPSPLVSEKDMYSPSFDAPLATPSDYGESPTSDYGENLPSPSPLPVVTIPAQDSVPSSPLLPQPQESPIQSPDIIVTEEPNFDTDIPSNHIIITDTSATDHSYIESDDGVTVMTNGTSPDNPTILVESLDNADGNLDSDASTDAASTVQTEVSSPLSSPLESLDHTTLPPQVDLKFDERPIEQDILATPPSPHSAASDPKDPCLTAGLDRGDTSPVEVHSPIQQIPELQDLTKPTETSFHQSTDVPQPLTLDIPVHPSDSPSSLSTPSQVTNDSPTPTPSLNSASPTRTPSTKPAHLVFQDERSSPSSLYPSRRNNSIASIQSLVVRPDSRRASYNSPSHIMLAHKIRPETREARNMIVTRSPTSGEENEKKGDNYLDGSQDYFLVVSPHEPHEQEALYPDDGVEFMDYGAVSLPSTPFSPGHEQMPHGEENKVKLGDGEEEEEVYGHAIIYAKPSYDTTQRNAAPSYQVTMRPHSRNASAVQGESSVAPHASPVPKSSVKVRRHRSSSTGQMAMSPGAYADLLSLAQTNALLEEKLDDGMIPSESNPAVSPSRLRPPSLPPKDIPHIPVSGVPVVQHAGRTVEKRRKKSIKDLLRKAGRRSNDTEDDSFAEKSDPGTSVKRSVDRKRSADDSSLQSPYPQRTSSLTPRSQGSISINERPPLPTHSSSSSNILTVPKFAAVVSPETPPLPSKSRYMTGLKRLATTATGHRGPMASVGDLPSETPRLRANSTTSTSRPESHFAFFPGQSSTIPRKKSVPGDSPSKSTHRLKHRMSGSSLSASMSLVSSEDSVSVVTPPDSYHATELGVIQTSTGGITAKKSTGSLGRFIKGMRRPRTKSTVSKHAAENATAIVGLGLQPSEATTPVSPQSLVESRPSLQRSLPNLPPMLLESEGFSPVGSFQSPTIIPPTPADQSLAVDSAAEFVKGSSVLLAKPAPSSAPSSPSLSQEWSRTPNTSHPDRLSYISTMTSASSVPSSDSIFDAFPSVPPLPSPKLPQSHQRIGSATSFRQQHHRKNSKTFPTSPDTTEVPPRVSIEPAWPSFDKMNQMPKAPPRKLSK